MPHTAPNEMCSFIHSTTTLKLHEVFSPANIFLVRLVKTCSREPLFRTPFQSRNKSPYTAHSGLLYMVLARVQNMRVHFCGSPEEVIFYFAGILCHSLPAYTVALRGFELILTMYIQLNKIYCGMISKFTVFVIIRKLNFAYSFM